MTTNGTPQFYIAEVIKNPDVESYKDENDKGNDHFLITVRTIGTSEQEDLDCRPANSHIKQIPLLHEHVLIFKLIMNFHLQIKQEINGIIFQLIVYNQI